MVLLCERPTTTTLSPLRLSRRAAAAPMPSLAPVMTIVFDVISICLHGECIDRAAYCGMRLSGSLSHVRHSAQLGIDLEGQAQLGKLERDVYRSPGAFLDAA